MIKFLLIILLISYLVYKVFGYFFKILFLGAQQHQRQQGYNNERNHHSHKKAPDSNLNIDYVPKEKKDHSQNFKGGDYVDFEELK